MKRKVAYPVLKVGCSLFLGLIFSALLAATATAQSAQKVAIIDSQKAFDRSAQGQKVIALLQDKENEIKASLKQRQEEINSLQDKFASQRLTLNEEALRQLKLEIDKKEAENKKYEQDSSIEFDQFKAKLIKKMRDEMLAIVDELVKERGYDLVFDLSSSGLIYFRPALDITEEVIKKYDEASSRKQSPGSF
ncbi:MAG TPA: OmpH family outer membrane protein [Candidatus Saccharicenans sp.]|nr:OmpH family outer membrane protein [Candidatus Saccharicenans sp.]HOT68670.1 OmpH family outer membrane protein [Candidatus Saccharicenans sp.]HPC87343.1 OmpH family outer membrane protein [Candidatus Saccharicenans sp.]HPP23222.1 OmpH family outer membrane protein [Candidatus Saccharicenans sp.]HQE63678.1 OmpH family outer membrane protein [Candidatus Saccharicenans sp.]